MAERLFALDIAGLSNKQMTACMRVQNRSQCGPIESLSSNPTVRRLDCTQTDRYPPDQCCHFSASRDRISSRCSNEKAPHVYRVSIMRSSMCNVTRACWCEKEPTPRNDA